MSYEDEYDDFDEDDEFLEEIFGDEEEDNGDDPLAGDEARPEADE